MEFKNLSVLALFLLAIVGSNGSKSEEEYWKSVWPNTPIPKALSELLISDRETSMPIKSEEENRYWTIFFEHDLYPGKTMNLGIQKHSDIQLSKSLKYRPIEKASQTFRTRKWLGETPEKENQPFELTIRSDKATKIETNRTKENQPFGFWAWNIKETKEANQPFGFWAWNRKETKEANQPFGFWAWNRKETKEVNQPFEFWAWNRKETKEANQPFVEDTHKKSQYFVADTSDEKEAHILNNYCRTPSAIGEDKHCALSLESMMDFSISKLGKNIKVMSSSLVQNQKKYVVEEVKKIGDKAVMCHRLNFKKVIFYCHTINATTTYMVPLVASDGTKSKALTICHHDTRGMNSNVLYEVLKVKPRTVSVCHFIGNKAIAWVPNMGESDGHPCVI